MKELFALGLLAAHPGCWDCVGLSDNEIEVVLACERAENSEYPNLLEEILQDE